MSGSYHTAHLSLIGQSVQFIDLIVTSQPVTGRVVGAVVGLAEHTLPSLLVDLGDSKLEYFDLSDIGELRVLS